MHGEVDQRADHVDRGVPVGDHHALRPSGRSARVVDRDQITLFDLGLDKLRGRRRETKHAGVRLLGQRFVGQAEEDVVLLINMVAENIGHPVREIGKILMVACIHRLLEALDQRTFLFVLEYHLTQWFIRFPAVVTAQRRKKNCFLFGLMMLICKTVKKIQKSFYILRFGHFQLLRLIGHRFHDVDGSQDPPMLLHQVIGTT